MTAKQTGRALRAAFDQLGSTYVKFGQLIASSPGAFGPDVSNQFRTLLDEGKPVPFHRVRAAVETAHGAPLETTFASFDANRSRRRRWRSCTARCCTTGATSR